jgi:YqaJ-like recombinase protein
MTLQFHDCEQGSLEWHNCRLGIPTASMFQTVMAKGRDGGASVTRKEYLLKLVGEVMTGELTESYSNEHMQRGKDMEAEARDAYAFITDRTPQRIGFITNGPKGCSPDSLLDTNGVLEIKTKLPHRLLEVLLRDEFPAEHKAQCQGALWVAEREWIDIAVYWPKMPLFVKRAYRDEDYIKKLASAVDAFNDELACTLEQVRRYQPLAEAA